jgi:hypothetical protein
METLNNARKEVGIEVNVEKTGHMLLSRDIKIGNRSLENVSQIIFGNSCNKSKFDSGGN